VQPRFADQNVSRFEIRYVKANADYVSGVLPALFCGPVSLPTVTGLDQQWMSQVHRTRTRLLADGPPPSQRRHSSAATPTPNGACDRD
jgi:hypothetical protein